MKWRHHLKYWLIAMALTVLALLIVYIGYILYYQTDYFDSVNSVVSFGIGLVSLLLSVVALVFSVIIYVSIDAVNTLSSMEGNVLCNENYNAEYMLLVKQYSDCKTQRALQDKLFSDINNYFEKHNKTCMQFTDFLQFFLDRLLWFAYVDVRREDYQTQVAQIIEKIEYKYSEFNAISNGNQYVLREHIKLIKNILNYQSVAREGKELDAEGEMLNIRGRMLVNGVSKTIYCDYLGLEYHKKALAKLREVIGYTDEEFLFNNMNRIRRFVYKDEEKKEIVMFLKQAQTAFDWALAASENDMLWKGYISFNKARIDLLSYLVNDCFPENWQDGLKDAVETRYFVWKLFDGNNDAQSFLELEFAKEYLYAEALSLSLCHYLSRDEQEKARISNQAESLKKEIALLNPTNEMIFVKTLKYLDDITKRGSDEAL